MPTPAPIVVIGAGISGLAAAQALACGGHDVLVLDRRPAVGGRIHTRCRDGFLVEHGPSGIITPAPAAERLVDCLGLAAQRIERGRQVRRRYLVRDGRAQGLPMDPLGFFLSDFFSLSGRVRLLIEPFIPPLFEDETVADFVRRRFGAELLDYVFDPLVGGLYAGDPRRLSVAALFPQLKRLEREHGSVIRGVMRARASRRASAFDPRYRRLFSFRQGMGALPRALARTLAGRLRLGVRVEAVEPLPGGAFRLHMREHDHMVRLRAGAVIVALPAYAASRVLAGLSDEAASALAGIAHPPLAVAALGYRRGDVTHPLDGLGLLAPAVEERRVLGMIFSSTLYAGRAPPGHALLTAYVGGARQPDLALLPRDEMERLVHHEARDLLGARGEPVFSSVRYWRYGLPQPDLGHGERVASLGALEAQWPGIFVTGNYVAGVSTAACIDAALGAAERAGTFLARTGLIERRKSG